MEFENQTRVVRRCIEKDCELGNKSIFAYIMNSDVPRHDHIDVDFMTRNLKHAAQEGHGSQAVIDVESHLRLDSTLTHTRARHQLEARSNDRNGLIEVSEYHANIAPSQTSDRSRKNQTAEASYEELRLTPLVPLMSAFVNNDVPLDTHSIGLPSKDQIRSAKYI